MAARDRDQTTPHHQTHLSSLVVRPSASDLDGYEPGEVRRDQPMYSRSDLYSEEHGYRVRAGSPSAHRRGGDHQYGSSFNNSGGSLRGREFDGRRGPGRFRDFSPPHIRSRSGGRPFGRGPDGPGFGPRPFRGEGMNRNNPNVRPREGDWMCPDPLCNNLNFARRDHCNSCKRFRPAESPPRRGSYSRDILPLSPPRRLLGPPPNMSPPPIRTNGYRRSPPPASRNWPRDGPRDFGRAAMPPPRHETRIPDLLPRDRPNYPEDDFRGREKFDRPTELDWAHRGVDRGRENFQSERRGFERRLPLSPPMSTMPQPASPPTGPRGRWPRDIRERSRSPPPLRGNGNSPPKEYRRDLYMERGQDERRGVRPDRIGREPY